MLYFPPAHIKEHVDYQKLVEEPCFKAVKKAVILIPCAFVAYVLILEILMPLATKT
jgi:hypothetical protein